MWGTIYLIWFGPRMQYSVLEAWSKLGVHVRGLFAISALLLFFWAPLLHTKRCICKHLGDAGVLSSTEVLEWGLGVHSTIHTAMEQGVANRLAISFYEAL